VELAGAEQAGAAAVELAQLGEEHGADRDVDPDPQGVRAADDLQVPLLRELLDQEAVLGQHPGVVHADAVAHVAGQVAPEARPEPEVADGVGDRVLLLTGAHVRAHERLGPLDGGGLGEVDDVHRRPAGGEQLLDRLVQRGAAVLEVEGHGPGGAADHHRRPAGPALEVADEPADVAEGR
jgi:hypothetical protein